MASELSGDILMLSHLWQTPKRGGLPHQSVLLAHFGGTLVKVPPSPLCSNIDGIGLEFGKGGRKEAAVCCWNSQSCHWLKTYTLIPK